MLPTAQQGRHQDTEGAAACSAPPSLISLPDSVLAHIALAGKQRSGHPLLQVSRGCRDAVLSSFKTITLQVYNFELPMAPLARLLHRACSQAPLGLELILRLGKRIHALPQLLQQGIKKWSSVHKSLVMSASQSVHLIPLSFPALRQLGLSDVELGNGELFSMLAAQDPCSLTSISLYGCQINDTAMDATAAALAHLPRLTALHLTRKSNPLHIASQLTKLTSLDVAVDGEVQEVPAGSGLATIAARNPGLQSLRLAPSDASLSHKTLMSVFSSCGNLTVLDVSSHRNVITDQHLDILLQHGTSITDLTLGEASIPHSRAGSPCSWRKLQLLLPDIVTNLACLPLRSVQALIAGDTEGELHLPLTNRFPSSQLLPLLQQAASNLVACPAWKKQPATRVLLYADASYGRVNIPDGQTAQLLSALFPLAGPDLQRLGISRKTEFGQQEVQALARSLGSSLKSLSLRRGVIKPCFWPALSQQFPKLKELGLGYKVQVNVVGMVAYLRTAVQPFMLRITAGVFPDDTSADLTASISAWQLQGLSVKVEEPDGDADFHGIEDWGDSDGEEEEEDEQGGDSEGEDWEWEVPDG